VGQLQHTGGHPLTGDAPARDRKTILIWEDLVKKPVVSVANLITVAGMLFAGYVFFSSLPDLRRYLRISTM
jgi:fumarate reductase subunit C